MINKRLIFEMRSSLIYIYKNVFTQWIMLLLNILSMGIIAYLFECLFLNKYFDLKLVGIVLVCLCLRYVLSKKSVMYGYEASKQVKQVLREKVFMHLNRMGSGYHQKIATSSLVQMCVEGIDQLEIYYGAYLSQLLYSVISPFTLFVVLSFVNFKVAFLLFICVPLIPITIVVISKIAKKLLSKYWGEYTTLGDSFLENLEGLTTLKIYEADEYKHKQMNEEAERFRRITMKVLTMQLNSITIMDLVAYGGAAFAMVMTLHEYRIGNLHIFESFFILLLAADFFIPMRTLGSLFHVAMNGIAASDKLFKFLDESVELDGCIDEVKENQNLVFKNVTFSYDGNQETIKNINLTLQAHQFTSIVGESGCGKSTLSALIMKQYPLSKGEIYIGNEKISNISRKTWMKHVTYLGSHSRLFKGTIKDNLLMANKNASEEEMIQVLKQVNIYNFLEHEQGLETQVLENGSNFSGGQCQRIAFAMALLHDSEIYIFDEATSNIDCTSEEIIMKIVKELSKSKTVILISHRLANVITSNCIYMLCDGSIAESGTHEELLSHNSYYAKMYYAQQKLEQYQM